MSDSASDNAGDRASDRGDGSSPGNIFEFDGFRPVIHESAFIHPNATVTGNVIIGRDVYVGPGAAIRGDWGGVVIEDGCNVQENCTVHMFPGVTVVLERSAHIGHGAIVHGARIGQNALIGMNAVVMDNAVIGAECIIGALCFVPAEMQIPARKVVVGNPAKIVKDVSDEMVAWKSEGTALYQALPVQLSRSPSRVRTTARRASRSGVAAGGGYDGVQDVACNEIEHNRRVGTMKLRSYAYGEWVEGRGKPTELFHAVTGATVGEATSEGVDFKGMLEYGRKLSVDQRFER